MSVIISLSQKANVNISFLNQIESAQTVKNIPSGQRQQLGCNLDLVRERQPSVGENQRKKMNLL